MKAMPVVSKFMTTTPHTIGIDIPVKTAYEMMTEHRIRHLPVQKGGKLVGMLTDRDVKLAASFSGADELKVEEVMTADPYVISPQSQLDEVVGEMAEHKYGSAVILDNNKVVGIFTAVDAMRVFKDILEQHYRQ